MCKGRLIIIGLQNLTWYQSCKINIHQILWPQKILLLLSPSTPWFTWLLSNYPPPIFFSGAVKWSLYCSVKNCMDILMAQHQCHLLPLSLQLTICGNNWISSSWAFCFLLSQKKLSITIGFTTSRDVWNSLETTFSQKSKACELQIKDELHLMRRGSRSISEYSRIFKAHCDQLSAMGRPVEDTDKVHWYLRGLGHEFSTFSITQLSLTPIPNFTDIVPKAESFDLFSKSIDHNTGVLAYVANFSPASSTRFGNSSNYQHKYKGGPSKGGYRHKQQPRRPPRCQICREEGHYATNCHRRYIKTDENKYIKPDANIAEALAHCTIHDAPADWYTDTGASAHMTADASQLDQMEPYAGKDKVISTICSSSSGSATSSTSNCINSTTEFSSHAHSGQSRHLQIQTLQLYMSGPIFSFNFLSSGYEGTKRFQKCCQVSRMACCHGWRN